MRAVALADKKVQETITKNFIPLKVVMTYPPKMEKFPLDWPALRNFQVGYRLTKGKGYTGCAVVSPDLNTQYGSTGSAMVWELMDSIAYDAGKFQKMLDQSTKFAAEEKSLKSSGGRLQIARFRMKVRHANRANVRMPPSGFSADQARALVDALEKKDERQRPAGK